MATGMDREQLQRIIAAPKDLGAKDLPGLRDLTERYPWFSGAQLLRAMGEQAAGEVLHEETLRTAAAHVPTRVPLYDAAHAPAPPEAAPTMRIVPASEPEAAQVASAPEVALPEPSSEAIVVAVDLPAEPEPLEVAVVDEVQDIVDESAAIEATPASEEPTPPLPVADPLDLEIRRAAMATSYELLMEHGAEDLGASAEAVAPVMPEVPVATAPPVMQAPEPVREEEPSAPISAPAPAPKPAHGRRSFAAWINEADITPAPSAPTNSVVVKQEVPLRKPVYELEQENKEVPATDVAATETKAPSLPTSELIDRFIQQSTPEPKPKATFFTPQQAGKQSLDDTAGMVTETLARIYEKQGNFSKAAEAYRKLALKYPDKSTYFAARQKELLERSTK